MQQINLYQPIFRKERKLFTTVAMVYGVLIFAIGLLVFWGWVQWELASAEERLHVLEQERDERLAQLKELQALHPERARDPALVRRTGEMEERLRHARRVLETVSGQAVGNRSGFADHLEGLARQRMADLWLTAVHIDNGGRKLALHGSAKTPEAVPRFVQRLASEAAFSGVKFSSMRMDRPESGERIDFVLTTEPFEEPAP